MDIDDIYRQGAWAMVGAIVGCTGVAVESSPGVLRTMPHPLLLLVAALPMVGAAAGALLSRVLDCYRPDPYPPMRADLVPVQVAEWAEPVTIVVEPVRGAQVAAAE